jgi:hypothetical protein
MKVYIVVLSDVDNGCDTIQGVLDSHPKALALQNEIRERPNEGIEMIRIEEWEIK